MSLRHICTQVLITFLTLCVASDSVVADKASDDFNLGVSLYRNQRWDQSSQTFQEFITEFPDHPRLNTARLYLAMSLSSQEKYNAARQQFRAVIEAEPNGRNIADARYRLGECSYYLKDYNAAVTELQDYLQNHPEHTLNDWAKLFLGDSFVNLAEYSKAEQTLKPLLASQDVPALLSDARLSLGRAYEGLKESDAAAEQYAAVAEMKTSESGRALHRLGGLFYVAKKYREAAVSYDQLYTDYPQNPLASSARLGAGMSWFRAGELENAIERFNTVPADSSGAAQAALMKGAALRQLKKYEEARTAFSEALKLAQDSSLAPEILFEHAQLERNADARETAAQLFEDAVDRFPQFVKAPDCIFGAAEMRLELGQTQQAQRLWKRLSEDYSTVAALPREQVLYGRICLAEDRTDDAITVFQSVAPQLTDMQDPLTLAGRYYLVRALYKGKQYDQVVQETVKIQDAISNDPRVELHGILVIAALSSLEMKQYESTLNFCDASLKLTLDQRQTSDVISARAIALCQLMKFPEALADLKKLVATNPEDPQTWTAVLTAAEAALSLDNPGEAESFFQIAAENEKTPAVKEAGEAGIAWSQFKSRKYADAEKSFARLVANYPASEDAAEVLFMMARSIEEQGDAQRTISVYADVFAKLTEGKPPALAGDEDTTPGKYILDAGQQVARGLQKLKQLDEADKAWERVVTFFPNAKDLDRILDEWAWMNASSQRFQRSDEIHRKLLDQFPQSGFAGQARLSLAESLLDAGKTEQALSEMEAIVSEPLYGATEKERALFHVIQIHVTSRQWKLVVEGCQTFLKNYGSSLLAPEVRLYLGDGQLQLQEPNIVKAAEASTATLTALRDEVVAGTIGPKPWTDHIWIVLAEAALAAKQYEQIDVLEAELKTHSASSAEAFKLAEIQGKRWKQQAPPNFEKSREYFSKVLSDALAEGTETAARCQFQVAETFLIEKKLEQAVKEFYKVQRLHEAYPALGAEALYKAALCNAELGQTKAAVRDLEDLLKQFPESAIIPTAKEELRKLGAAAE